LKLETAKWKFETRNIEVAQAAPKGQNVRATRQAFSRRTTDHEIRLAWENRDSKLETGK
jgi:hypothetical protein